MSREIDCALFELPAFVQWPGLAALPARLEPVALHRVPLAGAGWDGETRGAAAYGRPAAEALARALPLLHRFDVCLLPVTPDTLAWARLALAGVAAALPIPLVLLARGLTAPALRDLLEIGAADFMLDAPGLEELKTRLVQCAARRRAPAPEVAAPATDAQAARPAPPPEAVASAVRQLSAPDPMGDSYRATRAQVLADFERDYVTAMLVRYRGNVTHAARAGNQDRRAFWQLMRKYSILSADFRAEGVRVGGRPCR